MFPSKKKIENKTASETIHAERIRYFNIFLQFLFKNKFYDLKLAKFLNENAFFFYSSNEKMTTKNKFGVYILEKDFEVKNNFSFPNLKIFLFFNYYRNII